MPTNDTYVSNTEHNNDCIIGIPAFGQTFNLNLSTEESINLDQNLHLTAKNVQEDIYNTGTSENLLHLVKNLR
jgi:hypothetical protein